MALKTKRPSYSPEDESEKLDSLISYINELSEEIEFKFEVLTKAVEQLRQMNGQTYERK